MGSQRLQGGPGWNRLAPEAPRRSIDFGGVPRAYLIGTSEATAAKTSRAGIEKRIISRIRVNMACSINFMFTLYQP
jgi:hypothetical protein